MGVGGGLLPKAGSSENFAKPAGPSSLEVRQEIPAEEISVKPGPWGPHQAHPGRECQTPGASANKGAAQTGSRHPPVGLPAAKSKELGAWLPGTHELLMDVASLFLQLEKGEGKLRDPVGDAASDRETSENRPAGINAPPP